MRFDDALRFTLQAEGGLATVTGDKGGRTFQGITQTQWSIYCDRRGLTPSDVAQLTQDQVAGFYRSEYWLAGKCDGLDSPLSLIHFDTCVNHGVGNANALLGHSTWADVPVPLEAFAYLSLRRRFMRSIVNSDPSQAKFLRGWLARVDNLRKEAGF